MAPHQRFGFVALRYHDLQLTVRTGAQAHFMALAGWNRMENKFESEM